MPPGRGRARGPGSSASTASRTSALSGCQRSPRAISRPIMLQQNRPNGSFHHCAPNAASARRASSPPSLQDPSIVAASPQQQQPGLQPGAHLVVVGPPAGLLDDRAEAAPIDQHVTPRVLHNAGSRRRRRSWGSPRRRGGSSPRAPSRTDARASPPAAATVTWPRRRQPVVERRHDSPASSNQRAAVRADRSLVVRSSCQLGQQRGPHQRVHTEPTVDTDPGDEQPRIGPPQQLAGIRRPVNASANGP